MPLPATIDEREPSCDVLFAIGRVLHSAPWPAVQGGRKHGFAGMAVISAKASKA